MAFLGAEHASLGHLFVLSVLLGWVGHNVVIRLRVVLHRDEICGVWCIDGNRIGLEVLACHDVQRQGADVSVWVLLALGQIGDEGGDVFFELREVHGHVVLVELRVLVVLLVASNGKRESRVAELGDHGPDVVADSHHLVLNVVDLALLCLNLRLALVDFVLQSSLRLFFLLSAHRVHLSVSLELLLDVPVLLFDQVDFAVEHVHVVEKRDVLLLSLDESGHDLINRGNACALLDLLKGILNDLDVSGVHVHQVLLLLIVVDDLVETDLEQDGRVGEVSDRGGAFL